MNHKKSAIITGLLTITMLTSCGGKQAYNSFSKSEKIKIVTTTSLLNDLATMIGGEEVIVYNLIKVGVDAHDYQSQPLDLKYLASADVIVSHGFGLESGLEATLEEFAHSKNKSYFNVGEHLDTTNLIHSEEGEEAHDHEHGHDHGEYDPHYWFDPGLWKESATKFTNYLIEQYSDKTTVFTNNLNEYLLNIDQDITLWQEKVAEVEIGKRILLTSHDAFSYFGRFFDFKVIAVQGLSTTAEVPAAAIQKVAQEAKANNVASIFFELGTSPKIISAVIEAAASLGHTLRNGGELYTASVGNLESNNTYLKMMSSNIKTIIDGIK